RDRVPGARRRDPDRGAGAGVPAVGCARGARHAGGRRDQRVGGAPGKPGVNPQRRAVADEVLAAGRAHDAAQSDRLARFRNVEPETAELLGVLVRATRARRVLELGTSNGYSTIWLADAVEATGGAVTSVEIDPARTAIARANLGRAGLAAELVTGDAAETLRTSHAGAWDLVF